LVGVFDCIKDSAQPDVSNRGTLRLSPAPERVDLFESSGALGDQLREGQLGLVNLKTLKPVRRLEQGQHLAV